MRVLVSLLAAVAVLGFVARPAVAVPVTVSTVDGPQDPLIVPEQVHELGLGAASGLPTLFPSPEEILSSRFRASASSSSRSSSATSS